MLRPLLRPCRAAIVAVVLAGLSAAEPVSALSFGPMRSVATMGQPLDASIDLNLQPGETAIDNCVSAQVSAGDVALPASQVTTQVVQAPGGGVRVRVRTSGAIEEPFLTLTVSVGCEVRFARQFTVFADPPAMGVVVQAAPPQDRFAEAPVAAPVAPSADADRRAGALAPLVPRSAVAPARVIRGEVQRASRERPVRAAAVVPNRARAALVAAAEPVLSSVPDPGQTASERRISSGMVIGEEGVARLRLDAPTLGSSKANNPLQAATQQREEALATAKIAVEAAEAANSSAVQKITAMEAQLEAARKEVADMRAALAKLQAERVPTPVVATPAAGLDFLNGTSPWLIGACATLLLLSTLLYLRLRRSDAERLQGWLKDPNRLTSFSEFDTVGPSSEQFPLSQYSVSPPTIPAYAPTATPTRPAPTVSARSKLPEPEMPVTVPAALAPRDAVFSSAPSFSETLPTSSMELRDASGKSDVSIEELLDVEQQAEFFVVLGQDDAAVELLTNHVMASGGASPMPYLKLLEIFGRTGNQTSYERTRKRFNARFNGVAPEWGVDPNTGRGLVDYPEVLARIERVWQRPVDAMAELQTLMFRNDSNLLFELPAYRDIALLFTLARQHHEEGRPVDTLPVDVLLPIGSEGASSAANSADTSSDRGPDSGLRLVLDEAGAASKIVGIRR